MGIAIKIADATFTKYIGIAEFTEDDTVIPDVPDTPDEPDVPNEPTHTHSVTHVSAKAATTTTAGNIEYWYCAGCNTYWSNASLTNEITKASTIIPATGEPDAPSHVHTLKHVEAKAATTTATGNIEYWYCTECGTYWSDVYLTNEITQVATIIPKLDEPVDPDEPHVHTLTHVGSKPPTATTDGINDHWYCAGCNRYWLDSGMKVEITKEDTIWPYPDEPAVTPDINPAGNIKGLFYLGGNQTDSLFNHAVEGGGTAEIPSTASVNFENSSYATFTGDMKASRITTWVFTAAPENGVTMVALFRVPTGVRSIVSAYQNSANNGFVFCNDRSYAYVDGTGAQRYYDTAVNSTDSFAICAFYAGPNGLRVVKSVDSGLSELYSLAGVVDSWTASAGITIGGGQANVSFGDPADIALVSIYEGDVSDLQLEQIFAFVREYGESKDLTID